MPPGLPCDYIADGVLEQCHFSFSYVDYNREPVILFCEVGYFYVLSKLAISPPPFFFSFLFLRGSKNKLVSKPLFLETIFITLLTML